MGVQPAQRTTGGERRRLLGERVNERRQRPRPGLVTDRCSGRHMGGAFAAAPLSVDLSSAGAQFTEPAVVWAHRCDGVAFPGGELGGELHESLLAEPLQVLGGRRLGKVGKVQGHADIIAVALPALRGQPPPLPEEISVTEQPADPIRVERHGAVAIVTIAHPPANAISRAVIVGISRALLDAEADPECRALVITGDGPKFFAAGADITEFQQAGGESIGSGQELTLQMEASRLGIIAAVNGIAFGGGCELALAADIRIASENARFGQPEIKLGIIPGWGGTQRLPRVVGRAAAMEMLLSGDPIEAARALEIGLINRVVPAAELMDVAGELAMRLGARAPLATAATKRAVAAGLDRPLVDGLAVELEEFVGIFTTDDAMEGVTAFLEKRAATWKGR